MHFYLVQLPLQNEFIWIKFHYKLRRACITKTSLTSAVGDSCYTTAGLHRWALILVQCVVEMYEANVFPLVVKAEPRAWALGHHQTLSRGRQDDGQKCEKGLILVSLCSLRAEQAWWSACGSPATSPGWVRGEKLVMVPRASRVVIRDSCSF